jgi:hypothetical protein
MRGDHAEKGAGFNPLPFLCLISSNRSFRRVLSPVILVTNVLLIGCSFESSPMGKSDNPQTNQPPFIRSAKLVPTPIDRSKLIWVQIDAKDPDSDLITFRHQWRINGKSISGQNGSLFDPRLLQRGDSLSVELTPYDGKAEGPPYTTEAVTVGNTRPEVTGVFLDPPQIRVGEQVRAVVEGSDIDQDSIRYMYRWWRNNREEREGEENVLETDRFSKGDTVTVQVTPYDGTGDKGKSMLAEPVLITNSPPTITSMPPSMMRQGRYEYQVAASDMDGDPLIYSLEMAPAGMKIDETTGRIEWWLQSGLKGTHRARVMVKDPEGAFAFQEFELILPFSSSSLSSYTSDR